MSLWSSKTSLDNGYGFLTTAVAELKGYPMLTPIGFLTVGSFIKKGGNLMQIFAIDNTETAAVSKGGEFVTFDTPVLDLQDVQTA